MAGKDAKDALIGSTLANCRVLERIGRGGMGSVYKGHHLSLDRPVAIKVLNVDLSVDEKFVKFFQREARLTAKLDHPNVVQIYDVGSQGSTYFIVMQFVDGPSLHELARGGRMDPLEAARLMRGLLHGLGFAHKKGVVHRDVKPSNIIIAKDGVPKLVDFGLARPMDLETRLTKGELLGTPHFVAPEQAWGVASDFRSDLYAIGASLYWVLSGTYPYTGKNAAEILDRVLNQPLKDLRTLNPGVPPILWGWIQRLMQKMPEDRYQSAQDALAALEDALSVATGAPVTPLTPVAEPPGTPPITPIPSAPLRPPGAAPLAAAGLRAPPESTGPFSESWSPDRAAAASVGLVAAGALLLHYFALWGAPTLERMGLIERLIAPWQPSPGATYLSGVVLILSLTSIGAGGFLARGFYDLGEGLLVGAGLSLLYASGVFGAGATPGLTLLSPPAIETLQNPISPGNLLVGCGLMVWLACVCLSRPVRKSWDGVLAIVGTGHALMFVILLGLGTGDFFVSPFRSPAGTLVAFVLLLGSLGSAYWAIRDGVYTVPRVEGVAGPVSALGLSLLLAYGMSVTGKAFASSWPKAVLDPLREVVRSGHAGQFWILGWVFLALGLGRVYLNKVGKAADS